MTALFFLVFAIPAFVFIKEKPSVIKAISPIMLVRIGLSNTLRTVKEIKRHRDFAWFLVAFYLLNDALVTLFTFISIYARSTMNLPFSEIFKLLLVVQLIGFPSAITFGILSDLIGRKKILLMTLALWVINIFILAAANSITMLYIGAIGAGLVVGSSQAIARSWLSRIVPEEKRSEFFGFNGFASKMAATTGPILFGSISFFSGNQRLALLSLNLFFVLSFIIFSQLKEA
jgi:UMF1 family MFS transporter